MKTFSYIIKDKEGIHARPAGLLVRLSKAYKSQIVLSTSNGETDISKLIALMALGVKQGDHVKLTVEGSDEVDAEKAVREFFEGNL